MKWLLPAWYRVLPLSSSPHSLPLTIENESRTGTSEISHFRPLQGGETILWIEKQPSGQVIRTETNKFHCWIKEAVEIGECPQTLWTWTKELSRTVYGPAAPYWPKDDWTDGGPPHPLDVPEDTPLLPNQVGGSTPHNTGSSPITWHSEEDVAPSVETVRYLKKKKKISFGVYRLTLSLVFLVIWLFVSVVELVVCLAG